MKLRLLPLLLGLPVAALTARADEPVATGVAHEAVKDIKYEPMPGFVEPAPLVLSAPILEPVQAAAPVVLSPYIVRELPHRTFRELNEALAQQRRLDSHALYSKGGLEMIIPPSFEIYHPPGNAIHEPVPRLKFILLRFRW